MDIDEADDVAHAFAVRSMPTFVVLQAEDGNEVLRFSGCNKMKLESVVRATCAEVVAGKAEDKKSK